MVSADKGMVKEAFPDELMTELPVRERPPKSEVVMPEPDSW